MLCRTTCITLCRISGFTSYLTLYSVLQAHLLDFNHCKIMADYSQYQGPSPEWEAFTKTATVPPVGLNPGETPETYRLARNSLRESASRIEVQREGTFVTTSHYMIAGSDVPRACGQSELGRHRNPNERQLYHIRSDLQAKGCLPFYASPRISFLPWRWLPFRRNFHRRRELQPPHRLGLCPSNRGPCGLSPHTAIQVSHSA